MATTLTMRCQLGRLVPVDADGESYLAKRNGQLVQVKASQPRSMEQNAMLWGCAELTFKNLPPKWEGKWADKYRMVKGLQLALGLTDDVAVPTKDGVEIHRHPSSIADMDRDEANAAVDLLIRGMARLLNVAPETLMDEAAPGRAA